MKSQSKNTLQASGLSTTPKMILLKVPFTDTFKFARLKMFCEFESTVNKLLENISIVEKTIANMILSKVGGRLFLFGGLPRIDFFFIIFNVLSIFFYITTADLSYYQS